MELPPTTALPCSIGPIVELDERSVGAYLSGRGLLPAGVQSTVRELSGGLVNRVFRVDCDGRALVVKQSLPVAQRTVLQADIGRALVEVAIMKAIKRLVGPAAPIPAVVDDDPDNYVCVMSPAPDGAVLYDTELHEGRFHTGTGARIGAYAAQLHEATLDSSQVAREFGCNPGFRLRDQTIRSAAASNPDLAELIATVLRRNKDEARALVDFDITPKNVLVHQGGITKLDFECAQWGDPGFDVGIVLAHFILHGFAHPQWRDELLAEARACFEWYASIRPEARLPQFVGQVAEYAGAMMLGRADGDLVFDYLVPHRSALRALVVQFASGVATIERLLTLAEATLASLEQSAARP